MKRKEVDDVLGGKDAWANADRTESMYRLYVAHILYIWHGLYAQRFIDSSRSTLPSRRMQRDGGILQSSADTKR